MTDQEETAQWLSGTDFAAAVVRAATSRMKWEDGASLVLHNPTVYEGSLELAVLQLMTSNELPIPVGTFSLSSSHEVAAYAKLQVAQFLLDQWKENKGPIAQPDGSDQKFAPWADDMAQA